jgi:tetratricopeptide (TPR) repeat protein
MRQSEFDKAIPLLLRALSLKPDFLEAFNQLGVCYLKNKQYSLAEKTLSKGIELHPQDGDLYANRAISSSRQGDLVSAERDYLQALKYAPALVSVYGDMAGMFQDHGELDKAKHYFDLAEQAGVETQDYYVNRLAFLLRVGDVSKAVAFGETGQKRYPANATLMLNLASAYQETRQTRKAVKLLEDIIEIDPDNSAAQHNLGIYYQQENNCLKAVNYFEVSIKLDGSRIEPYLGLAACYESLSQYGDAEKSYRQMAEKFPERYEVYYNRGNFHNGRGMIQQSVQDFERSFALMDKAQPSSPQKTAAENNQYSLLRANAYQTMRRFQEAAQAYQHYLSFNKTDAGAHANYAYCLVEIGNPQSAIEQLEASYKLRSDEIDALIGLFATHSLLNDAARMLKYRRLAEAKLQHPLNVDTLDELSDRGYFYSEKFRQVWRAAVEK